MRSMMKNSVLISLKIAFISGLFELIKRIFNIRAVERFGVDTWHKDVRFFDLIDETGEVRGSF